MHLRTEKDPKLWSTSVWEMTAQMHTVKSREKPDREQIYVENVIRSPRSLGVPLGFSSLFEMSLLT